MVKTSQENYWCLSEIIYWTRQKLILWIINLQFEIGLYFVKFVTDINLRITIKFYWVITLVKWPHNIWFYSRFWGIEDILVLLFQFSHLFVKSVHLACCIVQNDIRHLKWIHISLKHGSETKEICHLRSGLLRFGNWDSNNWDQDFWDSDLWDLDIWDLNFWDPAIWDPDFWYLDNWDSDFWDLDFWDLDFRDPDFCDQTFEIQSIQSN